MDNFDLVLKFPEEIYLRREKDRGTVEKSLKRVLRIAIEPGNGIFSEIENEPESKSYPERYHVRAVNTVKKAIYNSIRVLTDAPYLIPFVFLAIKTIKKYFAGFTNVVLRDYYFKPQYYLASGQEIYWAVMNVLSSKQSIVYRDDWDEIREDNWCLLMSAVMIWEHDTVYRFRGQFLFSQIDLDALRKNPKKELRRVIKIMADRENEPDMKDKWNRISKLLTYIPLGKVKEVILRLNMNKMRLDENDLYWAKKKGDFNYDL